LQARVDILPGLLDDDATDLFPAEVFMRVFLVEGVGGCPFTFAGDLEGDLIEIPSF